MFCSLDGKQKSYCTPEAYRGETCWLFRNRGNGTFEDVTATCGIFDSSSKSLGVALIDDDQDGWPDLFVANDTAAEQAVSQPAKRDASRTSRSTPASRSATMARRARAWAWTRPTSTNSGRPGLAITNFENEMIGLYRPQQPGPFRDVAQAAGLGPASRNRLGFGCLFADFDLDGDLDLVVANGHIDDTVRNIRGQRRATRRRRTCS